MAGNGLLDFLSAPEGQGLLAAAFGGLAGARKGQPINSIGRAGMAGLQGYSNAQDRQQEQQRQGLLTDWNKTQRDWAIQDRARADADRSTRQSFLDTAFQPQPMLEPSQAPQGLKAINPYTDPNFAFQAAKSAGVPGMDAVPMGVKTVNPMDAVRNKFSPEEAAQLQSMTQPPKPRTMTVKAGDRILNQDTMQEVYSAPEKQTPSEIARLMAERDALPEGHPSRAAYNNAISKATTHAPAASVSVNTGQKGLDNAFKLRDGFKAEPIYKAHQETESAYRQIKAALGQGTPASDLAAATKMMKILDPTSVVRESELGMAMQASGLMDRLTNYAGMVVSGQKLTPTQRKDFQALSDALYSESVTQFNSKRGEYEKLGGGYELNTDLALGPSAAGAKPQAPAKVRRYNPATGKIE